MVVLLETPLCLVLEQFPIMRGNGIGPYYAALTPIITFEHLLLYYLVLLMLDLVVFL